MRLFYQSVLARYAQALGDADAAVPDGGYQGEYLAELGKSLATNTARVSWTATAEQAASRLASWVWSGCSTTSTPTSISSA